MQPDRFGLDRRIERIADRHAVEAVVARDREAQAAAVVDDRRAGGNVPGACRGVGNFALETGRRLDVGIGARRGLRAQFGSQHIAAAAHG